MKIGFRKGQKEPDKQEIQNIDMNIIVELKVSTTWKEDMWSHPVQDEKMSTRQQISIQKLQNLEDTELQENSYIL